MSKILFASMPFDGHFGPLTGLAVHLKARGHDVRFYTGPTFGPKLAALGIPHLPYRRARDVNAFNLVEHFPEAAKLGTGPKAISFALEKVFFGNLEAHFRDVNEIKSEFPFDAVICDAAFYAADLLAQKTCPNVYSVHPAPTPASKSKTAPPPFFGLTPATNVLGRLRDRIVWAMVESSTQSGKRLLNELLVREGLRPLGEGDSVFDLPYAHVRAVFQTGVPGMDFPRTDLPAYQMFVGPMLPPRKKRDAKLPHEDRILAADSVVVVSQGTVDNRDPEKLFVPTLKALAGGPRLVVATTGGMHTEALRARFPQSNVIVEDWIDFDALMKHTDVFVCNGGYGSIMQSLVNGVPLLTAGKNEGKNDINARLAWRGLSVDLGTERPSARKIARGIERVLTAAKLRENVARVQSELLSYDPFALIEARLAKDGIVPAASDSLTSC